MCISMELVTAVLGDHGQRPREDYGKGMRDASSVHMRMVFLRSQIFLVLLPTLVSFPGLCTGGSFYTLPYVNGLQVNFLVLPRKLRNFGWFSMDESPEII